MMSKVKGQRFPLPAGELVPHRPPMLLISELLFREDDYALVSAITPEDGLFVFRGKVVPEYLIEVLAQAMAAMNGYDSLQMGKRAPGGVLAGIDRFEWQDLPGTGCELQVHVEKVFEFAQITVMKGQITECGRAIAQGELKLWLQED